MRGAPGAAPRRDGARLIGQRDRRFRKSQTASVLLKKLLFGPTCMQPSVLLLVPQVGSPNQSWPPPVTVHAVTSTPVGHPVRVTHAVSPPLVGTVAGTVSVPQPSAAETVFVDESCML